jgi:hypothetical protein
MPYKDPLDPRKLAGVRAWGIANAEKVKEAKKKYAENNKEVVAQRIKAWRDANPEKMNAARIAWAVKNKHKINAKVRRRQAAKIQRTPAWLTENEIWMMQEAYELAIKRTKLFGFQWDVDHIYPLQGKIVSGLHVPLNLQVIPAKENYRKGVRI